MLDTGMVVAESVLGLTVALLAQGQYPPVPQKLIIHIHLPCGTMLNSFLKPK